MSPQKKIKPKNFINKKTRKEFMVSAFILFLFWMANSLPSDICSKSGLINLIEHIILGLIFASIITYFYPKNILNLDEIDNFLNIKTLSRLSLYFTRLLLDIFLSGIDVARRVLRKDLVISPGIVEFKTPLSSEDDISLNANSITLTPGTITIDAKKTEEGSIFLVHCISQEAVKSIQETGGFVERISRIYGS